MTIKIGSKIIKLEPVGTLLLGSRGRVDVVGPLARARLILIDAEIKSMSQRIHFSDSVDGKTPSPPPPKPRSDIKWAWKIVTRPPRQEIVELNKESFLNLLVEISNG
jgi:hypothetical protein